MYIHIYIYIHTIPISVIRDVAALLPMKSDHIHACSFRLDGNAHGRPCEST